MRLSCEFKAGKIPIAYQMMFVSLIKEALKNTDQKYYKKLYYYDNEISNKETKNFCFSVFLKNFIKEDHIFQINDRIMLNISSPDYEFMVNFYNGLLKMKTFKYKDFCLNNVGINLINEKKIIDKVVTFNTLSPICIKDKFNNALEVDDARYQIELNYIAEQVLCNYRGYGLKEKLLFTPINMKKKVIKEDIRAFRQNTGKPYYYVNAYSGVFNLEGSIDDLRDIYILGLGFKRAQGFGMLEVID